MHIERRPSNSDGRSLTVAFSDFVWTVATARDNTSAFEHQVGQSLDLLGRNLELADSARTHILSLQVLLTDIANRPEFDVLWQEWIGSDPRHWPQRACFGASLAPGLLIELVAVAARSSVPLAAEE